MEINEYNYVGNTYYSELTSDQLWSCVSLSYTREELDAAISAQKRLNEIINDRLQLNVNP